MLVYQFLIAGLGLGILLLAGDTLVRGAVNLALRAGLPALIVSLTIVAFGTSAPELLIAIEAIDDGVPGLALGNVVGSNTANILMVLGIPAMLAGMNTSECDTKRDYILMIGATFLFIALCFTGQLVWWHGAILLTALFAYLGSAFWRAKTHKACGGEDEEVEGADPALSYKKIALYIIVGLIGLPIGADLLVDSSVIIAKTYGVSDVVIGLTLVAIGTSLPELATTVMAALRNHADVALGNVIGSNMFNLLGIMGVATLVGPIPIEPGFLHLDLWIMLGASILLIPFVFFRQNLTRFWGIIFSALYVSYIFLILS